MREITHNEVCKLYDCIHELSEYHNKTSVNFKGYYPLNSYENTLESFENALRKKESYIAELKLKIRLSASAKSILKEKSVNWTIWW